MKGSVHISQNLRPWEVECGEPACRYSEHGEAYSLTDAEDRLERLGWVCTDRGWTCPGCVRQAEVRHTQ